ncbi:MAG TPA: pyridoxal phosphate-dependent aminotransferase [Bacteroidales bacterium]|nr:pyridoxal phosphate-dependent aminotransferase [Bacteroidales bacterium]
MRRLQFKDKNPYFSASIYSTMNPVLSQMTPFIVMEVLEKAKAMEQQGISVIHLEVGEPDFSMPSCISSASHKAIDNGHTHYTHSLGDLSLRKALTVFYHREYNVDVDPECIVITSGSSPAILMMLMTLCDAGEEVLISNPGYPCYRNFILSCHAVPVDVPVSASNDFQFEISQVMKARTTRTKAIMVNSPMNPCGVLVKDDVYRQLVDTGIPVISDEIYHGLVYSGKTRSVLEFSPEAIVVSGFSKRFAMTGLRLGYIIAPRKYIRSLQILQQNLFICAPSLAQQAAVSALENSDSDVAAMRRTYDERRVYMLKRLRNMGFEIEAEPQGAFYIFANACRFTCDSYKFAFDVLQNAHVGITPGTDFGTRGEGYVRFSYANSLDHIREGMDRLERYLVISD